MKGPRKPKPPKLTPAQVETLERVWLETANASEAARQAGCSERSVRRHVIRHALPKAAELYARALEQAEREHLATLRIARRKVSRFLRSARTSKAVAELTRAATSALQGVTSTRMAHAKITGALVEKHEVNHSGNLVIHMPDEKPPAKDVT